MSANARLLMVDLQRAVRQRAVMRSLYETLHGSDAISVQQRADLERAVKDVEQQISALSHRLTIINGKPPALNDLDGVNAPS